MGRWLKGSLYAALLAWREHASTWLALRALCMRILERGQARACRSWQCNAAARSAALQRLRHGVSRWRQRKLSAAAMRWRMKAHARAVFRLGRRSARERVALAIRVSVAWWRALCWRGMRQQLTRQREELEAHVRQLAQRLTNLASHAEPHVTSLLPRVHSFAGLSIGRRGSRGAHRRTRATECRPEVVRHLDGCVRRSCRRPGAIRRLVRPSRTFSSRDMRDICLHGRSRRCSGRTCGSTWLSTGAFASCKTFHTPSTHLPHTFRLLLARPCTHLPNLIQSPPTPCSN